MWLVECAGYNVIFTIVGIVAFWTSCDEKTYFCLCAVDIFNN